jgi:ABC-type thiamine transport system ATPase subunit
LIELGLSDVVDAGMGPLSLTFGSGLWVMLGDSAAALERVLEILAGVRRARRGRVLLGQKDVFETPGLRKRIASLLPEEALLPASSVSQSLELAAELRGSSVRGGDLLERAGLARFASLPPERLSPAERRAVALAFTLEQRECDALLLHDPFSLSAWVPMERVVSHCRVLSERACVLVTTTRLEDAIALGGWPCRLERGRLVPNVGLGRGQGEAAALVVRTPDAPRLSRLLATHAAIHGVVFDERRSPRELVIRGADLPALARSLCEVAHAEHIVLEAFAPLVPARMAGSP